MQDKRNSAVVTNKKLDKIQYNVEIYIVKSVFDETDKSIYDISIIVSSVSYPLVREGFYDNYSIPDYKNICS